MTSMQVAVGNLGGFNRTMLLVIAAELMENTLLNVWYLHFLKSQGRAVG